MNYSDQRCEYGRCTNRTPVGPGWQNIRICQDHALYVWSIVEQANRPESVTIPEPEPFAPPTREPSPGTIYYLRVNGYIKIGWTSNWYSRAKAYSPGTELLALEPGTRTQEATLHSLFTAHLAQGREWFHPCAEIDAHIAEVIARVGEPTMGMQERRTPGTTTQRVRPRKGGAHAL